MEGGGDWCSEEDGLGKMFCARSGREKPSEGEADRGWIEIRLSRKLCR